MPNFDLQPDFIEAQYRNNQTNSQLEVVNVSPEGSDAGVSSEASSSTNPVLIETYEGDFRRSRRLREFEDE